MANEEKELFKFLNNPKYREKVIAGIHKGKDNEYNRRIKKIESERNQLVKNRVNEISRISNARWEKLCGGKLFVNRTEGKIRINDTEHLFSDIQGAELNMISGCRTVTTDNSKSQSKKNTSLGGALVGGAVAGPIGAVVGGSALGKTKTTTTGSSVSNQIPTCIHLGVKVNINGFVSEVVFISSQVNQDSMTFSRAQSDAQKFISQLGALAKIPVPASFLRPEEESSVKAIDAQIVNKQNELQTAIADTPVYMLPDIYRTEENSDMSDEEYLQYLKSTDEQRAAENAEKKAAEKEAKHQEMAQKFEDCIHGEKVKSVRRAIRNVVFWIASVFCLPFAIVSFTSDGGILSGILFLLTAICINPLLTEYIRKIGKNIPLWVDIVLLIVGFFTGLMTIPTA